MQSERTVKHTELTNCLNHHYQRINICHSKEPSNLYNKPEHSQKQKGMRPDLEIRFAMRSYHYDISTTDSHAASYRSEALKRRAGAIILRENHKTLKYKPATDLLDRTEFVPVVFDAYGGIGPKFEDHLKIVARYARENCLIDYPHEWMRSLLDTCSCIIVKANADMCYEYNLKVSNAITNKPSAAQPSPSKSKGNQKGKTPVKSNAVLNRTQSTLSTPVSKQQTVSRQAPASAQNVVSRSMSTSYTNYVKRLTFH